MSLGSLGAKAVAVTALAAVAALSTSDTLPPGFAWVPVILATAGNSGEGSDGTDRTLPIPIEEEEEEFIDEEDAWFF